MAGGAVRGGAGAGGSARARRGEAARARARHLLAAAGVLAGAGGGTAGPALAAAAGRAARRAAEAAGALGAPLPRGALRGLCRGCGGPLFDPGARGRKGRPGAGGGVGVDEEELGRRRARPARRRADGPQKLQLWRCRLCGTGRLRKRALDKPAAKPP